MSGGVGPTAGDISLPEDDTATAASTLPSNTPSRRFISFRQLNALAVAFILTFMGMVRDEDAAFPLSSLPYFYFLSFFVFPSLVYGQPDPPVFGNRNILLSIYVSVGVLVGLFLPIAYILHGVVQGDKEGIKAAVPNVFLFSCQVFMEGDTFFSPPMRIFVQVVYVWKRLITICQWLRSEIAKEDEGVHGSITRVDVGRVLALVNWVFWSFNWFGFLLPVHFPRTFMRYYLGEGEGVTVSFWWLPILLNFVAFCCICVCGSYMITVLVS